MNRLLLLVFVFLGIATIVPAQKPTDKRLAGLDTFVNKVLQDWHAPGVGIAVVEKNKVVYAGGFGFADYENKRPVTGNTLFAIGSCTKAFTSALLGKLQADGKLDFDEKVTTYVPEVAFYNDYLTDNVTVRDLTCHRTGIPRHDFSWYLNGTSRDSLVQRIRYMENFASLREKWYYNNFMFLLQGVISEKLYGKSWEDNISEQFFQPLGMTNSNFALWAKDYPDEAKGYYTDDKNAIKPQDYYKIAGMGPAGSIFSNPVEMANWVMAWINGGKFNGKQVIPEAYVKEAMSSQMVINAGLPTPESPDVYLANYGMGWFLASYRGHYRVEHGGNIDGFSASTAFYPTDSIGIVVLTNQNGSAITGIIRNFISDRMLKLPYKNWNKQIKDARDKALAAAKEGEKSNSDSLNRKPNTRPSHALADYAGNYENAGYGAIQLSVRKDSLFIKLGEQEAYLEHYHYDVFRPQAPGTPFEELLNSLRLQFTMDLKGEVTGFDFIGIEPALEKITFEKKALPVAMAKSELEKYTGEYELAGMVAKVNLRGETLWVVVPGQPDYETVPVGNHEFKLKVLDGYSVRFEINGDKATAMLFIQPNGTFKATRKG
ncbi:MAG: serine hydrolase [Saprospiraceae bacterium]